MDLALPGSHPGVEANTKLPCGHFSFVIVPKMGRSFRAQNVPRSSSTLATLFVKALRSGMGVPKRP